MGKTGKGKYADLERELQVAEEYHSDYVGAIDKALGHPRDLVDGALKDEHVQAIILLKAVTRRD